VKGVDIVRICKKEVEQIVIIIEAHKFANYTQNFTNILLSILTPFAEEIIGRHQCVFRLNMSTTDLIFCIRQLQCVPLATEPGISLIILTPMKILQQSLNRSTFFV